jgi:hypothetical protein
MNNRFKDSGGETPKCLSRHRPLSHHDIGKIDQAKPRTSKGKQFAVVYTWIRDNDPSAGSPTETLLRLLLPLNDQV